MEVFENGGTPKTDVLEWKIHLSMDELGISILGNLHLCKFYGFYSSYDLDKYCTDGYFSRWCFFFHIEIGML